MAHKEELGEVARWAKGIVRAHACIADGYGVPEPRRQALDYLRGLLSPVERKNGWQPGGAVGGRQTRRGAAVAVHLPLGCRPGSG